MRKGSITIFSLLSMMLVMTCLFTLLEGARLQEIKRLTQLQTELAIESVFGNYSTYLWQEYRLLACKQESMQENLVKIGNARYDADENRINLLQFQVENINLRGYTLLTDGNGLAYIKAVSTYMKNNLLYETIKNLYNQYEVVQELQKNSSLDMSAIDDALQGLEDAKADEQQSGTSVGTTGSHNELSEVSKQEVKNPLEEMKALSNKGVLELVIEDTSKISSLEVNLSEAVSKRSLLEGKNSEIEEINWMDCIYLQQYLLSYLSNYTSPRESGALSYELEYLIGKNANDTENLKVVVTQLMGIREMANYLYLLSSPEKVEEARLLAITLVGASVNPVLIEVVKTGLLAAWAFAESVLDVRAILLGKSLPFIKNDDLWTLNLAEITSISKGYATAKESELGLTYRDYLGILLLFQQNENLAFRAMDIQEITIQDKYDMSEFRMDSLMIEADVEIIYNYKNIFPIMKVGFSNWNQGITTSRNFGYE